MMVSDVQNDNRLRGRGRKLTFPTIGARAIL
jgi:hypothetical protein